MIYHLLDFSDQGLSTPVVAFACYGAAVFAVPSTTLTDICFLPVFRSTIAFTLLVDILNRLTKL